MSGWSRVQQNVSLKTLNSWLLGGMAELYAEPQSIEELRDLYVGAFEKKIPVTLLSGGTNVLVSDDGVQGLTIGLKLLNSIETETASGRGGRQEFHIHAEAGVAKSELLKFFLREKLAPALFLAGLPGHVGGGVVMNAGVSEELVPHEFQEITDAIEVLKPDGETVLYKAHELEWDYRKCEGWRPGVIVKAHLSWPLDPEPEISNEVRALNKQRILKQPLEFPSCGSVFRNPEGDRAGRLIESAGLKGFCIGGAEVSTKHANFIINKGQATAVDIRRVIEHVQLTVFAKFGVQLQTEVVWLGKPT